MLLRINATFAMFIGFSQHAMPWNLFISAITHIPSRTKQQHYKRTAKSLYYQHNLKFQTNKNNKISINYKLLNL